MSTLTVAVINGNPAERILVIAPTLRQFEYWCHENGINPRAPNAAWVFTVRHLRGYSNAWYVVLGYPEGREGERLFTLLEHMKATRGFKNAETA